MEDKFNYNLASLMGGDVNDEDYVVEFGLDPNVAYTPAINNEILNRVEKMNIDYFIEDGMSEKEAIAKARDNRERTMNDIKKRLAAKGKL